MPNSCGWEVDTYLGDRFKKKHEGDKLSPLSTLQDCKDGKRLLTNFADFFCFPRIKTDVDATPQKHRARRDF